MEVARGFEGTFAGSLASSLPVSTAFEDEGGGGEGAAKTFLVPESPTSSGVLQSPFSLLVFMVRVC